MFHKSHIKKTQVTKLITVFNLKIFANKYATLRNKIGYKLRHATFPFIVIPNNILENPLFKNAFGIY